ncbi:MAG: thermonuclease family protein [Anaerolinea sp.]|nr:thermonuclease family protein [Anaerolinea sp.]MCC6973840.1 thermonuclease family protein [Anaerolineae bacterium]
MSKRLWALLICACLFLAGCEGLLDTGSSGDTSGGGVGSGGSGSTTGWVINYPSMPNNLQRGSVVRVVDGDTAIIRLDGSDKRVRFIGMNTPESVAPDRPQECFGKEASKRAEELLSGKTVLLEVDQSQDQVDQYGRLLRFVWFEDGRLFNMQMIAEGYAYEYTYQSFNPHKYQAQLRTAQRDAERENRGLWSPNTCNGQR